MNQIIDRTIWRLYAESKRQWLFRHGYKFFSFVGHPRTGSNYLLSGTNQLESLRMNHEIFSSTYRPANQDFFKTLSGIYRRGEAVESVIGFKLFLLPFK